jgi:hypothetical protein
MINKISLIITLIGCALISPLPKTIFCEEEMVRRVEFNEADSKDPFASPLPQKDVTLYKQVADSGGQGATLPIFSVQGLVWGTDKPQAIIDNKIFNIGDEIKGAKIIAIDKDGVKILYQERTFLVNPEVKGMAPK